MSIHLHYLVNIIKILVWWFLRGRPTKTWRSTFKEDLVDTGVDWNSVRAVATNRSRWRNLAAHCPDKDRRI